MVTIKGERDETEEQRVLMVKASTAGVPPHPSPHISDVTPKHVSEDAPNPWNTLQKRTLGSL